MTENVSLTLGPIPGNMKGRRVVFIPKVNRVFMYVNEGLSPDKSYILHSED